MAVRCGFVLRTAKKREEGTAKNMHKKSKQKTKAADSLTICAV